MMWRSLIAVLCFAALGIAAFAEQPVRLAATAFGVSAEVEVRDLPPAEARTAAHRALQEIFEISRLADPETPNPGGVGWLNAAAGQGPQPLHESVTALLLRGLQLCIWSSGAHGPIGGELYRLWESSGQRLPKPAELRRAVGSADCSRLTLTGGDAPTAELPESSRIDTSWLARGFAIDRAVHRLEELGVENAWLEIGPVYRGLGAGPDGRGWLITLPRTPGTSEPIDQLWLRDQALAITIRAPDGELGPVPLLDQRTGVPARGTVAVVVVSGEAWDAEALSAALFILGRREGQLRLGGYSPRPSILWLLGEGDGAPLESSYRWSELNRVPRRR